MLGGVGVLGGSLLVAAVSAAAGGVGFVALLLPVEGSAATDGALAALTLSCLAIVSAISRSISAARDSARFSMPAGPRGGRGAARFVASAAAPHS